jgi:hypothetical protein
MMQIQAIPVTRRESVYLAASIGAGIVAALGSLGLQLAMGVRIAPLPEIAWSAFVAGIAGGLLYRVPAHFAARPVLACGC